jgi:hypothetical protein
MPFHWGIDPTPDRDDPTRSAVDATPSGTVPTRWGIDATNHEDDPRNSGIDPGPHEDDAGRSRASPTRGQDDPTPSQDGPTSGQDDPSWIRADAIQPQAAAVGSAGTIVSSGTKSRSSAVRNARVRQPRARESWRSSLPGKRPRLVRMRGLCLGIFPRPYLRSADECPEATVESLGLASGRL